MHMTTLSEAHIFHSNLSKVGCNILRTDKHTAQYCQSGSSCFDVNHSLIHGDAHWRPGVSATQNVRSTKAVWAISANDDIRAQDLAR